MSPAADPFAVKLLHEAQILSVLGYLTDAGDVLCPECGASVEREKGWRLRLACDCGWLMEDLDP